MSGDVSSEVGSVCWSHGARAKVSEWLSQRIGSSDITSGFGSMGTSASYVEKMDELSIVEGNLQPEDWFAQEISMFDTVHPAKAPVDRGPQRRNSF